MSRSAVIALRTFRNLVVTIVGFGIIFGVIIVAITFLDSISKWIFPTAYLAVLILICFGVAVAQTDDKE